jgi:hypothetical protein
MGNISLRQGQNVLLALPVSSAFSCSEEGTGRDDCNVHIIGKIVPVLS